MSTNTNSDTAETERTETDDGDASTANTVNTTTGRSHEPGTDQDEDETDNEQPEAAGGENPKTAESVAKNEREDTDTVGHKYVKRRWQRRATDALLSLKSTTAVKFSMTDSMRRRKIAQTARTNPRSQATRDFLYRHLG